MEKMYKIRYGSVEPTNHPDLLLFSNGFELYNDKADAEERFNYLMKHDVFAYLAELERENGAQFFRETPIRFK